MHSIMKIVIPFLLTLLSLSVYGQKSLTEESQPIVAEGKMLYKSEMASWYGTDLFLESYQNQANIGGYFSYTENDVAKCIFFSKVENPKVIGTISFDNTFNIEIAKIDLLERDFTPKENDFYQLRRIATDIVYSDTLFKIYTSTNFNIIPIIDEKERKVYVLTGTGKSGVVIFGNDYLLTFDNANNLISKKALHQNIIPINYGDSKDEEGNEILGSVHSHLPETGDFITATDICTLMLYSKFAKWKQHTVISKNYLNIWNCETNELVVIPTGTLDKINKDQEKSKKKKRKKE